LSDEDYITAIDKGIRKINYYTYMSRAGTLAAKKLLDEKTNALFHDVVFAAQEAMKKDTEKAMKVFYKNVLGQ